MDDIKITDRLRHEKSMNPDRNEYRAEVLGRAADHIALLEAVVRALDDAMRDATAEELCAVLDMDRGCVWGHLFAARARVNLSTPSNSSVNPATLTSQSQAEGIDGTERKGKP